MFFRLILRLIFLLLDEFEFLNLSQNDDNISREILDEIAQTVAEDEEYLHLLAKRNRLISTQKKLQSQDFNDLLMSILYDENNNLPMKSFELKDKRDFRLTRARKRTFGGSLINPIKYYSCLICGDKHLDYSIRDLKNHYRYIIKFDKYQDLPYGVIHKLRLQQWGRGSSRNVNFT